MMACWNSADLCAVRFSLLDTDGSPLCSEVDGSAYSLTPISLAVTLRTDAGETVTTRTGCGDVCYTRTDPDVVTGADLVLTLCNYDPELIGLMAGGEIFTENGAPGFALGTTAADPGEFHAWTKSLDGSAQNPSPNSWFHHAYPDTTWSPGNYTFGRDSLSMVMNGKANVSTAIGTGAFGDIPVLAEPFFEAHWTADDIPLASVAPYNENALSCGFFTTPACS